MNAGGSLTRDVALDGVRAMARRLVDGGWHPANVVCHAAALEAFCGPSDEYHQLTAALGYPEFCRQLTQAAWACRQQDLAECTAPGAEIPQNASFGASGSQPEDGVTPRNVGG